MLAHQKLLNAMQELIESKQDQVKLIDEFMLQLYGEKYRQEEKVNVYEVIDLLIKIRDK